MPDIQSPLLAATTGPMLPRLRIAMVTETYPPEINGVAHTVAQVVQGLRASGHVVQLVRPRQGQDQWTHMPGHDARDEILTPGMKIPLYGHLRMGLPARKELMRAWTRERPALVHIATEGPLGWSALQAARALQLPVCSDFRTNFHAYSRFYRLGWLHRPIVAYLRHFHNRCHATMVPTESLQEELASEGFRSLNVLARGVDTTLFAPAKRSADLRRAWGVDDQSLVVLHVGRLAPEKNLPLVMQAFTQISADRPDARLVLVGDGPSRAELQAKNPKVIFAGFRSGEDLAAHYASSDMFLFPSLTETYGNVTPEAMASGLAMVAFDDAAAGQLIEHGTNGLLATKADVSDFITCAADLAIHRHWREAMGTAARDRVAKLGWDAIVSKIERIYASTIHRAHAPVIWSSGGTMEEGLAASVDGVPARTQRTGASVS